MVANEHRGPFVRRRSSYCFRSPPVDAGSITTIALISSLGIFVSTVAPLPAPNAWNFSGPDVPSASAVRMRTDRTFGRRGDRKADVCCRRDFVLKRRQSLNIQIVKMNDRATVLIVHDGANVRSPGHGDRRSRNLPPKLLQPIRLIGRDDSRPLFFNRRNRRLLAPCENRARFDKQHRPRFLL